METSDFPPSISSVPLDASLEVVVEEEEEADEELLELSMLRLSSHFSAIFIEHRKKR